MYQEEIKTNFYLRKSKCKKDGQAPIYAWVEIKGKRKHLSTGVSVHEENWSSEEKLAIGNSQANGINKELRSFREELFSVDARLKRSNRSYTLDSFINLLRGVDEGPQGVMEFFAVRLKEIESQIGTNYTKSTYINFRSASRHLKKYLVECRRKEVGLEEVGTHFIEGFYNYLRTTANCQQNSANKYLRALRAVLNHAQRRDLIAHNPFDKYSFKYEKKDREFLSKEELEQLIDKSFKIKRVEAIKDIFLLSCFTGLSYSDIRNLRKDHINTIDGNKFIIQKRQKSGIEAVVPLLPQVERILNKYESHHLSTGQLLPVPSNQKVNAYLKEIADLTGIQKNLTFHMARHTFATTVTMSNNVPIESISKMLGHTSLKTTQIYAKVLNDKLVADMRGLGKLYQ